MPFSIAAMLPGMKSSGAIAFSIKVDPVRFPAELWPAFQRAARTRGEIPVDVLRGMLERYIAETPTPPVQER